MPVIVCDIGNSQIKISISDRDRLHEPYSLPTCQGSQTRDGLGLALLALLRDANVELAHVAGCIFCSVAPRLNDLFREACRHYLRIEPLLAPDDICPPLENRYGRPKTLGADRLLGAWGARKRFPGIPGLIVADYGTALTFDCVAENVFMGGLIFPGPYTALKGLIGAAGQLPPIEMDFSPPASLICTDTPSAINCGLAAGYAALTEGICAKLAQIAPKPQKIIATGGYGEKMLAMTSVFDAFIPNLVLEGLFFLYREHA